ncbi:hypothetical protein ACFQ07_31935 [Actinomadura adrarensis]|uniref:Tissue inhibitor of metalloproteinase n=1 Tax=Actinomadura adrarensis TaxID=1819600 RepID=A0ABW3CSD6_9ACTN
MKVRGLVAVLMAVGTVLFVPGQACACSCAMASEQEKYAQAEAVFSGRLLKRKEGTWLGSLRGERAQVELVFDVDAVTKGQVTRRQTVLTESDGAACGLQADKIGRTYLVFAHRQDGGLSANLCGGTRLAGKPLEVPAAPSYRPAPGADQDASTLRPWLFGAVGVIGVSMAAGFLLILRRRGSAKP